MEGPWCGFRDPIHSLFVEADKAQGHIDVGAKKVIVSAPGKGALKTLVMGVNHTEYDKESMDIISNAS